MARVRKRRREGERQGRGGEHRPRVPWVGESKLMECHFVSYVPPIYIFLREMRTERESKFQEKFIVQSRARKCVHCKSQINRLNAQIC